MHGRKWQAALPVLALSLAACGAQSATGADSVDPEAQASDTAPPPEPTTPGEQQGGSPKPAGAVKKFVAQVLEEKYSEACMSSVPVLPADRDPAAFCARQEVTQSLTSLHDAWAKPGVKLPPAGKLVVNAMAEKGADTVTVPDSAITLDGRSLRELELIGSSGDTDSFTLSFEVKKKDGAWYVGGWNISA